MSRTILTTGLALKARVIWGVDDDGVQRVFKSFNSSGVRNEDLVNADMTVSGTLSYSDITWAGGSSGVPKTLKTVKSISGSYVQFGTNKPYIDDSTVYTNGLLMIYTGLAPAEGVDQFATRDSGGRIPAPSAAPSNKMACLALTTVIGASAADVASGNQVTMANQQIQSRTDGHFYVGESNVAILEDTGSTDAVNTLTGQGAISKLLADASGNFWTKSTALFMIIGDDYANSAARLAALQPYHNDPYGTIFEAPVGGGNARARFSTLLGV
ncbi:MAG TPA: hypothetical protein VK663_01350 [Burkholderiales bacterium]|nr:hypothetical protein [Burkholderiales bacterium]